MKVICFLILKQFADFYYSFPPERRSNDFLIFEDGEDNGPGFHPTQNILLVMDTDEDGKVTFAEFKAKIESYLEIFFTFLDSNGDGSLDVALKEASLKKISLQFLLDILNDFVSFMDLNQDDSLSTDDLPQGTYRDRNDDGRISLREMFGISLINLPAPVYRLYTLLDQDKNEKMSREEATNFIKGTFYVIDQNEDCFINLDEFINTLKENKLPMKFQIAIKLLADHYFTLLDFALDQITTAADRDGDKKTTLAETIDMTDTTFFTTLYEVFDNMFEPNYKTLAFLAGDERRGEEGKKAGVREMWLNVLYDFVDNRKYRDVPSMLCGIE